MAGPSPSLDNRRRQLPVQASVLPLTTRADARLRSDLSPIETHTIALAIIGRPLQDMASLPAVMRSAKRTTHSILRRQPISDIAITRTGKPILRTQGGRCATPRHWVTLDASLTLIVSLGHPSEVRTTIESLRASWQSDPETQDTRLRYLAQRVLWDATS